MEDSKSVVIKRYASRRLYNPATSAFVTLYDLAQMVRGRVDFKVVEASTGEDITRGVLTQVLIEEEGRQGPLLPISFLRDVISLRGHRYEDRVS